MSELEYIPSEAEIERLKVLEGVIVKGIKAMFEMGMAMKEIRDTRLYRIRCDNWREYCRQVWDMGKAYVDYQIAAADVIKNLKENAHHGGHLLTDKGTYKVQDWDENLGEFTAKLPANERQARPLTLLSPAEQIVAWERVVEATEASGQKITAVVVDTVVRNMLNEKDQQKKNYMQRDIEKKVPEDFGKVFNELIEAIDRYKSMKWKGIDRKMIVAYIRQLEAEFLDA